jgi:uncharacterized protein YabE (DUF348 family)
MIVKTLRWLAFSALVFTSSCQSSAPTAVNIVDGAQVHTLTGSGPLVPVALVERAGLSLAPGDLVLLRGYPVDVNERIPSSNSITLEIRRAVTLVVNGKSMQTAARTVGEALAEAGSSLHAADQVNPPPDTPVSNDLAVVYIPSREFTISADQQTLVVRSAAASVGAILSEAGLPLIGLDFSHPAEDQPAPQDGKIRVVRVSESIVLAQTAIPFQSQYQSSSQVELDHQQILQPGQPGLAVSRTRIRYEDGQEVSRRTEAETVARPPADRVVGYGTKVVVHTATVDGTQIQYWRAIQMFATAYSPCNSAADRCYPGTSSGKPVEQGVVAVKYSWYLAMQGQALYIPGYGRATIEDVCGGCVGKPWIDIGYTDAQFAQAGDQWGKYVTVYFLAPPPVSIIYVLQ